MSSGVADLIQYVRSNPDVRDAQALAEKFGVDRAIVEASLARATPATSKAANKSTPFVPIWRSIQLAWERATSNPVLFVAVSAALQFLLMTWYKVLPTTLANHIPKIVGSSSLLCGIFILPLVMIFGVVRHGNVRNLAMAAALSAVSVSLSALLGRVENSSQQVNVIVFLGFVICLMYLIIGTPLVVFGAYRRVRKAKRQYDNMDRQQLVERLLTVRIALEQAKTAELRPHGRLAELGMFAEKIVVPAALVASVLLNVASSALLLSLDPRTKTHAGSSPSELSNESYEF